MNITPTYNFRDGMGPVAATQHINPDGSTGGWVATTAYVDRFSWLGLFAQVFGNASVTRSTISGKARISGNAQIDGSAVVGNVVVEAGALLDSHVETAEEAEVRFYDGNAHRGLVFRAY